MKFRIGSTDISVSYLLVCAAASCVVMGAFEGFVWCCAAVTVHESGHLAAMCALKNPPESICVSLFEIKIKDRKRQKQSLKNSLIIIFSGPAANFVCFILFYLLYLECNEIFLPASIANLSVGLFNILPVISLDGGQALFLLCREKFGEGFAQRAVCAASFAILFPLTALGFLVLFNSRGNFSLLLVCVYIVFSLIMRNNEGDI